MTQAAPEITESYSPETLTDHELLLYLVQQIAYVQGKLTRLEDRTDRLLGAWSLGGLRGLRQAARSNGG